MRLPFLLPGRRGPLVLDAQRPGVAVEGPDGLTPLGALDRVAVVAHWSPNSRVSRSLSELSRALVDYGYAVVLVSASDDPRPREWPGEKPASLTVLRRPNIGYDFGSWAAALDWYPQILAANQVLLLNDSLAGPFQPIDHLLKLFDDSAADVWGLTDSTQMGQAHLQSYCLGFKDRCLQEAPLARFWRGIRVERSRDDIIRRYELGLGRLLDREHFVVEAAFRFHRTAGDSRNPTIHGWRRLLDDGFPFVKRELLRRPEVASDGLDVPGEVMRRFGVDVYDWVPDRRGR
jgi:lipopolysaccharide biosynthesis protein